MNFEVRVIAGHEIETVRQLLLANGWSHRVESASKFETLVQNSDHAVVAVADDIIMEFACTISDHLSNGYVSVLPVLSSYRRLGISRFLKENLLGQSSSITRVLRASRDGAKELFSSPGFTPPVDAMELKRQ